MSSPSAKRKARRKGKPSGPVPDKTSLDKIARTARELEVLDMRVQGNSLRAIGAALDPPCSGPAVYKTLTKALARYPTEKVDQMRAVDLQRLDEALLAIYPAVTAGDIAAIDRMLSIMQRRARLMGVDVQPERLFSIGGGSDAQPLVDNVSFVRVEIINNPEIERLKWLEQRVALAESGEAPQAPSPPANDLQ